MNVLAFIVLTVLVIFFIALWFDARAKGYAQQYKSASDEKIRHLRNSMDDALTRITKLEEKTKAVDAEEQKEMDETERKPVTADSVCLALRRNGYTPEVHDLKGRQVITFKADDTLFRLDTTHLPFLAIELGYGVDPSKEDMDLMRRAAAEVTVGIFIGKVIVYDDNESIEFNAELLCDSYVQLRDCLKKYLDVIFDTRKRFSDVYNRLKEEKRKMEEELASRPFQMNEGNNAGTKILS